MALLRYKERLFSYRRGRRLQLTFSVRIQTNFPDRWHIDLQWELFRGRHFIWDTDEYHKECSPLFYKWQGRIVDGPCFCPLACIPDHIPSHIQTIVVASRRNINILYTKKVFSYAIMEEDGDLLPIVFKWRVNVLVERVSIPFIISSSESSFLQFTLFNITCTGESSRINTHNVPMNSNWARVEERSKFDSSEWNITMDIAEYY